MVERNLALQIHGVIENFVDDDPLTLAQAVGALELVKHDLITSESATEQDDSAATVA